jgi:hypothetical protein
MISTKTVVFVCVCWFVFIFRILLALLNSWKEFLNHGYKAAREIHSTSYWARQTLVQIIVLFAWYFLSFFHFCLSRHLWQLSTDNSMTFLWNSKDFMPRLWNKNTKLKKTVHILILISTNKHVVNKKEEFSQGNRNVLSASLCLLLGNCCHLVAVCEYCQHPDLHLA